LYIGSILIIAFRLSVFVKKYAPTCVVKEIFLLKPLLLDAKDAMKKNLLSEPLFGLLIILLLKLQLHFPIILVNSTLNHQKKY
jgi:hypothetical protein